MRLPRPAFRCSAFCLATTASRRRHVIWVWCRPPNASSRPPPLARMADVRRRTCRHRRACSVSPALPRRCMKQRGIQRSEIQRPDSSPARRRDGGRSRVHLPVRRNRRTAAGRRMRRGRIRPARRRVPSRGHRGHLPGRRFPRSARRRTRRQPSPDQPNCAPPSPRASRRSPSARGCSTSAAPSTARPWSGRCPPTRR